MNRKATEVTTAAKGQGPTRLVVGASKAALRILSLTEIRAATWSRIYAQGLATGHASLVTSGPPTWEDFDRLMLKRHRWIATHPHDNRALGWIAAMDAFPALSLGPRPRPRSEGGGAEDAAPDQVGGGILELLVYVAADERGQGAGRQLVDALVESLRTDPRWSTLQANVFPENVAALAMLRNRGFDQVGQRVKAGRMKDGPNKGQWRDMITLEKRLEHADQDGSNLESGTGAATVGGKSPLSETLALLENSDQTKVTLEHEGQAGVSVLEGEDLDISSFLDMDRVPNPPKRPRTE